jgi:hypothetical protein
MESNIYPNETNNIDLSNQTLSSIKLITFIKINNILGATHLNSHRLDQLFQTIQSTRQLHLKEEGLNFQEQSSFAKHSEAAGEVCYHGYHTKWTQREGIGGGGTMSQPTWPKDLGHDWTN